MHGQILGSIYSHHVPRQIVNVLLIQGVNVKAPWKGSPDATNTISGTSMAAPHVVSIKIIIIINQYYDSS